MIADNTNNNENNKSNVNGSSNEMDIDDVIPQWLDEARKNWDKIRSDILESYAAQEVREYPNCRCNVRSKRLQVRKAGRNQGKYFFTCHKITKIMINVDSSNGMYRSTVMYLIIVPK